LLFLRHRVWSLSNVNENLIWSSMNIWARRLNNVKISKYQNIKMPKWWM
jgi:hypothetical protein